MKVAIFPADSFACGWYRCYFPAEQAAKLGVEIDFGVRDLAQALNFDVVVFQRPMHTDLIYGHIPALQARGVAVVVEIDDDYTVLNPNNHAFYLTHPRLKGPISFNNLIKATSQADVVTCTTPALARKYASHGRYSVLPNLMPRKYLEIANVSDGKTVGWAGSLAYHPDDLEVCGIGVLQGLQSAEGRYLGIGDSGQKEALRIPDNLWEHQPPVPIAEYPHQLARLTVGIVPLRDNAFNRAKSSLKMLEMASVGAFPVGSPSPDNVRLHETYGIGAIADKPKHWKREINYWLTHEDERSKRVATALGAIQEDLTYDTHGIDWVNSWAGAIEHRKARYEQRLILPTH